MEYLVGAGLGLAVGAFATVVGFDRGRAFYPVVLVVIASYYDLFAVLGGSMPALGIETLGLVAFAAVAVLGFRTNLWWVVAALAAHGIQDLFHASLVDNPGRPALVAGLLHDLRPCRRRLAGRAPDPRPSRVEPRPRGLRRRPRRRRPVRDQRQRRAPRVRRPGRRPCGRLPGPGPGPSGPGADLRPRRRHGLLRPGGPGPRRPRHRHPL
jgi:hypothetical protein